MSAGWDRVGISAGWDRVGMLAGWYCVGMSAELDRVGRDKIGQNSRDRM